MAEEIKKLTSRAYQLELFEASMNHNIIAAMATGSGKTNIACLRIQAELQRTPQKIVWFVAPNVVLAEQQHYFLSNQLPEYQMRTLLGHDKVDLWHDQKIWDAALANMNVIISTPQVLLDALRNAFVRLLDISLLVFDEAHHCQANSPEARIMKEIYHPSKSQNPTLVPYVLGLTASIRISSKTATVEELEATLDAVCCTPTRSIEDYTLYVHHPELITLDFMPVPQPCSGLLNAVYAAVSSTTMHDDPYYQALSKATDLASQQKLKQLNRSGVTRAMRELKQLLGNAEHLHLMLGSWASDVFIQSCVENWHEGVAKDDIYNESLTKLSKEFIDRQLLPVRAALHDNDYDPTRVSSKARILIDYLATQYQQDVAIIIFVERRSAACALCELLKAAPELSQYRIFSFVGLATSTMGSLIEVADRKMQKQEFADFRNGSQDICVATSVAEEGVDIQAVNLVIRFDDPKQFVSYLQSRGRARKPNSKFVSFRDTRDKKTKYAEWAAFERELQAEYEKDARVVQNSEVADDLDHGREEVYRVESTGAILSYDNAVQHLSQYCTVVSSGIEPIYIFHGDIGVSVTAKVVLPSRVPAKLQEHNGLHTWYGQKAAKRDVAFQAFKALHQNGSVNENLVPFRPERKAESQARHGTRLHTICGELPAWRRLPDGYSRYYYQVEVSHGDTEFQSIVMALPYSLQTALNFSIHDNEARTLTVSITQIDTFPYHDVAEAQNVTIQLFEAAFGQSSASSSLTDDNRLDLLVAPGHSVSDLEDFEICNLQEFLGKRSCRSVRHPLMLWDARGFRRYVWYPSIRANKHPYDEGALIVSRIKRLQLFTGSQGQIEAARPAQTSLAVGQCFTKGLASVCGPSVLLVPTIIHMMAAAFRAQQAKQTVFANCSFSNASYLTPALISKSASGLCNYERLEFIGDAYLKFRASLQMFLDDASATEGVLTSKVHKIVSNMRLERCVQDLGLGRYITTKVPTQKHWRVPKLAEETSELSERKITSKTLADVAESTLGALLLDESSSEDADERCTRFLQLLLPEVQWSVPLLAIKELLAGIDDREQAGPLSISIHNMLCYHFRHNCLLREALTHSTNQPGLPSLDRLEFLGDALIDQIVKARLFSYSDLSPDRMTHCRHALVSHSMLAFYALGMKCSRQVKDIETSKTGIAIRDQQKYVSMTDLVQYNDSQLRVPVSKAHLRYDAVKAEIEVSLSNGKFPWTLLRRIDASKTCSDIIESLVAAVYLDSGGSLAQCEQILERIGLLNLLDQMASNPDFEVRTPATILRLLCASRQQDVDIVSLEQGDEGMHTYKVVVRDKAGNTIEFVGRAALCDEEASSIAAEVAYEKLFAAPWQPQNCTEVGHDTQGTQGTIMTGINRSVASDSDSLEDVGGYQSHK